MADNSRAINRVFTRKVICELLQGKNNDIFDCVIKKYIHNPVGKKHEELFSEIYSHLGKQNRNEYYYINTLLNKLLSGIHNVNTTTALSQVHIGHSIADFVMINGEGRVYEIKSDLDNFDRLSNQLHDYYRAFSKVSVLAPIHELNKVKMVLNSMEDIGNFVGVYVLSEQNTIFNKERSREPVLFNDLLDYSSIFKILRKYEYENILKHYYGRLPDTVPVFHFRVCLEWFKNIPIIEAQKLTFQELKKRNNMSIDAFRSIQPELKSLVYFSGLDKEIPALNQFLKKNYRR